MENSGYIVCIKQWDKLKPGIYKYVTGKEHSIPNNEYLYSFIRIIDERSSYKFPLNENGKYGYFYNWDDVTKYGKFFMEIKDYRNMKIDEILNGQ